MSKITFNGAGGGGGVSDHGGLAGLSDDDHSQYLLRADFAASGAADKPTTSGAAVGAGTQIWLSGIGVGDRLYTEAEVTLLAEAFVEGGTANPVSGVNVGATTQIYISGISVGDRLGGGGVTDHGLLTGLTNDDHTQYLLQNGNRQASGLSVQSGIVPDASGTGHIGLNDRAFATGRVNELVVDTIHPSASGELKWNGRALIRSTANGIVQIMTNTGGTGGQLRVGNIRSDAGSGVGFCGTKDIPWASGEFNNVILYAPNGTRWYISVDNSGILSTTLAG